MRPFIYNTVWSWKEAIALGSWIKFIYINTENITDMLWGLIGFDLVWLGLLHTNRISAGLIMNYDLLWSGLKQKIGGYRQGMVCENALEVLFNRNMASIYVWSGLIGFDVV